jgi:N-acetyl-gamma-glutamyl-phosphate reductase
MTEAEGRLGVGILGATGYAGSELARLLIQHPRVDLRALGARRSAGQPANLVLPHLPLLQMTLDDDKTSAASFKARGVEVMFACLPHGVFAAQAAAYLEVGIRVIDLSGDFRLRTTQQYRTHYHHEHPAPHLLEEAVYGLCEWCDEDTLHAPLVANPGCYATAILLGLMPPVAAGWLSGAPVVVNALSGVSGAGRGQALSTQYGEVQGSAAPYRVGEQHPHLGEIRQMMASCMDAPPPVIFNPHLVPMARGIVASLAISLNSPKTVSDATALYEARYADSDFVQLLGSTQLPESRFVRGSNRCDLAIRLAADGRMLLVFAAIDNLLKGAAGQAVQNLNRMHGWDAKLGLSVDGFACI